VVAYFNTLLIFRTRSVMSYQYSSDPAQAIISLIVPGVGLSSKDALVSFESLIYWMYDDRAYEFSNNRANQINQKVPFVANNSSTASTCPSRCRSSTGASSSATTT
jgi:hypothetical protein